MYIKKLYGRAVSSEALIDFVKGLLDVYDPPKQKSVNFKHWQTVTDLKTCPECRSFHGQIYPIDAVLDKPPCHFGCRCTVTAMEAVRAGYGTKDRDHGADYWLKHYGVLPGYYITKDELEARGWRKGKPPKKFAPDRMVTMGVYNNLNQHLPQIPGRIWYEADINYKSGRRNRHRLLWSNDGLIFVTYNHYETFLEII